MATTSLWHIKGDLGDLIAYVENPEKTIPKGTEDFFNVFSYIQNPQKTADGSFVTTINCLKQTALRQMILTKQEQMERFGLQEKKELTARSRELDKAKQRVAEIDRLIQKSYEDMAKGLLSEERFATLTVSLETEQRQLKADIPELEASLSATADKADDLQKFIQRARQVTRLTELTPEIVHEFIEKIVVSKPEKR